MCGFWGVRRDAIEWGWGGWIRFDDYSEAFRRGNWPIETCARRGMGELQWFEQMLLMLRLEGV